MGGGHSDVSVKGSWKWSLLASTFTLEVSARWDQLPAALPLRRFTIMLCSHQEAYVYVYVLNVL